MGLILDFQQDCPRIYGLPGHLYGNATIDCNVENAPRPQFQLSISTGYISQRGIAPGRSNSIQVCGGNAPRPEFQKTISSTFLDQIENVLGPSSPIQIRGGNAPRQELQDFSQSENALRPSNLPRFVVEMSVDHPVPIRLH